jgi:histone H3/H4
VKEATPTKTSPTKKTNASAAAATPGGSLINNGSPSKANASVSPNKEEKKEAKQMHLPPALVEACEGQNGVVKAENLYKIVRKVLGEKHLQLENKAGKNEGEEGDKGLNVEIDGQGWSLLSGIAEQLVMSTLQFAVKLVNHRQGSTIEPKDIARYLKTNMQINVHANDMEEDLRANQALKRRSESVEHWERQEEAKRLHTTNTKDTNGEENKKEAATATKDVEMKQHALKL